MRGIRKYFAANGVEALRGADFDLVPGEIHALIGENGAGKSTLMHILAGSIEPSAGTLSVDGADRRFRSPAQALAAGIGMVRQHPSYVPGFRFWEDCVLGAERTRLGLLDRRSARESVAEASRRWGFGLDVDRRSEEMTVSARQKGAVLSLLLRGVRCLVLDEPSAVLTPAETDRLFALLRRLRSDGRGIVLISHKLEETLAIADRVTVLRRGKTVATGPSSSFSAAGLASLLFGTASAGAGSAAATETVSALASRGAEKASALGAAARRPAESPPEGGAPALRVRGLSVRIPGRPFVRSVALEAFPGRILGVAGVRDSGLETLELAVTGLLELTEGSVELCGRRVDGKGPLAFREAGGAYLSADRAGSSIALRLPLRDSIIVHAHRRLLSRRWRCLGALDAGAVEAWTSRIMADARVRGSAGRNAESFSGGMLQRVALAREFAENAPFMVLAEPGWGLDGASRAEAAGRIRRYVRSGGAALLFSTDVDELISLSDEILVLRDGRVAARFEREGEDAATLKEAIGAAMIGREAKRDPA